MKLPAKAIKCRREMWVIIHHLLAAAGRIEDEHQRLRVCERLNYWRYQTLES